MRFRHKIYKDVLYKTSGKRLPFEDWEAETDDPDLIDALKKNPDVEVIDDGSDPQVVEPDSIKLDELNKNELLELAKEKGLTGYSQMNKDELKQSLEELLMEGGTKGDGGGS